MKLIMKVYLSPAKFSHYHMKTGLGGIDLDEKIDPDQEGLP